MKNNKCEFFEDIAESMEYWGEAVSDALEKSDADLSWVEEKEPYQRIQHALSNSGVSGDDLKQVLSECLRGFAVSILTSIDGGTTLAEKGRIYLVDADGKSLGDGLHDAFVRHLLDTGRLK
ncbi:MAG: hypothetical protein Q8J78_16595 [Moraxellaceae bacterium]|nr:hypothetical protein [Moraxellaceae bacterium]